MLVDWFSKFSNFTWNCFGFANFIAIIRFCPSSWRKMFDEWDSENEKNKDADIAIAEEDDRVRVSRSAEDLESPIRRLSSQWYVAHWSKSFVDTFPYLQGWFSLLWVLLVKVKPQKQDWKNGKICSSVCLRSKHFSWPFAAVLLYKIWQKGTTLGKSPSVNVSLFS